MSDQNSLDSSVGRGPLDSSVERGHLDSSIGSVISSDKLYTSDEHIRISLALLTKISNCSCSGMYHWFDLLGCGGFTGYFPAKCLELHWLSPTTRQLASKKQNCISLSPVSH